MSSNEASRTELWVAHNIIENEAVYNHLLLTKKGFNLFSEKNNYINIRDVIEKIYTSYGSCDKSLKRCQYEFRCFCFSLYFFLASLRFKSVK